MLVYEMPTDILTVLQKYLQCVLLYRSHHSFLDASDYWMVSVTLMIYDVRQECKQDFNFLFTSFKPKVPCNISSASTTEASS